MTGGGELLPLVVAEAGKTVRETVGATLTDVWQGIIGDRVAAWRLRNAADLNEKLTKELAKTGQALNLDNIPERFAFGWFDKATQSDEPEIQELFAKLLANAAAGNEDALKRRNIELISSLTPDDARLLERLADAYREFVGQRALEGLPPDIRRRFILPTELWHTMPLRAEGLSEVSIDALESMGVVRTEHDIYLSHRGVGRAMQQASKGASRSGSLSVPPLDEVLTNREFRVLTLIGESLIHALYPGESEPVA